MDEDERQSFIIKMREANARACAELHDDIAARAVFARPIESHNTRVAREIGEQERQWAAQREREVASKATAQAPDWSGWEAWLRVRLDAERALIIEAVGSALGEEREEARRELADEVKRLRLELAETAEVVTELRRALAAGNRSGGEIIDLPARRVN